MPLNSVDDPKLWRARAKKKRVQPPKSLSTTTQRKYGTGLPTTTNDLASMRNDGDRRIAGGYRYRNNVHVSAARRVPVNSPHVAFMLHGVAGSDWESLKHKENCCDMTQHEQRRP